MLHMGPRIWVTQFDESIVSVALKDLYIYLYERRASHCNSNLFRLPIFLALLIHLLSASRPGYLYHTQFVLPVFVSLFCNIIST